MGRLYDNCTYLIGEIERRGLDPYRSRGAVALRTGFLISVIGPDESDDPVKIAALHEAAREELDIVIPA